MAKPIRQHRIKISGKVWTFKVVRLRGKSQGWCYSEGAADSHKILIDDRVFNKKQGLEVVIHETLHALHPQLSEESVTFTAFDLAKVLSILGWKKDES